MNCARRLFGGIRWINKVSTLRCSLTSVCLALHRLIQWLHRLYEQMQLSKCDWWPSLFLRLSVPGCSAREPRAQRATVRATNKINVPAIGPRPNDWNTDNIFVYNVSREKRNSFWNFAKRRCFSRQFVIWSFNHEVLFGNVRTWFVFQFNYWFNYR